MSLLDKLERLFGRFAISNLAIYLIIGQVFIVLTALMGKLDPQLAMYAPAMLKVGQWWRVVTFLFVPIFPGSLVGYVFLVFGWYLFYLMSSALEAYWGAFRFNVYFFMSYLLTVGLTLFAPLSPVTNIYILGTVFLAFAYLNPDFEFTLFFILPVKVKWLALITWAFNTAFFILGDLSTRLQIAASTASFFLFFGGDLFRRLGLGGRRSGGYEGRAKAAEKAEPRHVCYVCGKTDISHPDLDFRYCSKCAGDQCYCPEHLQNHTHVGSAHDSQKK